MTALVASVFVAAILGSVHCAAMCGGFACLASAGDVPGGAASRRDAPPRGAASIRGTASYNTGRLLSYVLLGSIAGAAGAGFDRAASVAGFTRPAAVVAGLLLIAWGVATLLSLAGVRMPLLEVPPMLAARVARGVRAVQQKPPAWRGLAMGMLTAALPCGWLYAFVATSAAAGSAAGGALVMAAFWAGTVPMLAAVGLGAQRLLGPFRRRLPMVTALALVVLGTLTVAGRFTPTAGRAVAAPHEAGAHAHR